MISRILKSVGLYFAVSVGAAGVMLIYLSPYYPKSISGWIVFCLLSLPVMMAGEVLSKFLFTNSFARKLEKKTAGKEVSWLRLFYTFIVVVLLFGLSVGAMSYFDLK